ncbi:MAG: hypothetical protein MJ230_04160 [bacterium]|nr:hypothetical protein [bacterium]
MNIIKDIIYYIFSLQENLLKAKLNKTLGAKNLSKRKKFFQNGCTLTLDSLAEDEKNKMEEELYNLLKQTNYEPKKLLEYIKSQGTSVYYIKDAKQIYSIGENEGFIYPQKGGKALYISLLTGNGFKLKTNEMFVLSKGEINKFYFIYHFYNWYAFKHGVFGVDSDSIVLLNRYLFNASDEDINKLQLSDIYKLKDAIKQDKASIEFVFKLCRDLEGAKSALNKIKDNGASI